MDIFNFLAALPQTVYGLRIPPIIKYVFHGDVMKTAIVGGVKEVVPHSALEPQCSRKKRDALVEYRSHARGFDANGNACGDTVYSVRRECPNFVLKPQK